MLSYINQFYEQNVKPECLISDNWIHALEMWPWFTSTPFWDDYSEQRVVLLLTPCLGTSAAHTRLEVVPGGGQASRCIFWNKQHLVPLLLSDIFICCCYCAMKLFWQEKLLVKSCSCTQDLWELTSPLSYSVMLVLWRYGPVLFGFFQQRRNKPSLYKHMMIYNLLGTTADTELPLAPKGSQTCWPDFTILKNCGQTHISAANEYKAGGKWDEETGTSVGSHCSTERFHCHQWTPDSCAGESTLFLLLTEELSFPKQLD